MKKCASCAKDLPDAALHCVFCGAKQAPAAPAQPSVAKTAFGYSSNEVMAQLGRPSPVPTARPEQPTVAAPVAPPASNAPPMPEPAYVPPQPQAHTPPPPSGGMGIHSPRQATPAPLPVSPAPYLASRTAVRGGRPIEPWKDSLRLWMIVWGVLALVSFAVPINVSPLQGNWNAIIDGEGSMKILPLIWAGVGFLSLAVGLLPMGSLARGIIAALLGIAGLVTPLVVHEVHDWRVLAPFAGVVVLVSGLLVRDEYVESLFARVLITLGVLAFLAPHLVPAGSQIPLVEMVRHVIDATGRHRLLPVVLVAQILVVVMSLLAWMPGPATGGAKLFAWLLMLFPVLGTVLIVVDASDPVSIVTSTPTLLVNWIPGVTFAVLAGYGLATAIGKQLE